MPTGTVVRMYLKPETLKVRYKINNLLLTASLCGSTGTGILYPYPPQMIHSVLNPVDNYGMYRYLDTLWSTAQGVEKEVGLGMRNRKFLQHGLES